MPKVSMISDLSEKDRKLALKQVKGLLFALKQCDLYLRDYAAGTQTAVKLLCAIWSTESMLAECEKELRRIHRV